MEEIHSMFWRWNQARLTNELNKRFRERKMKIFLLKQVEYMFVVFIAIQKNKG